MTMTIGEQEVPEYTLELVREKIHTYQPTAKAADAAQILHKMLDKSPVEQFVCIYMDPYGKMVGAQKVAMGEETRVEVSIRSIFRGALQACVDSLILGHNHPSGLSEPSNQDLVLTAAAIQAGRLIGMEVYDHVIVSPNGTHFSIFDNREKVFTQLLAIKAAQTIESMIGKHPLVDPLVKPLPYPTLPPLR